MKYSIRNKLMIRLIFFLLLFSATIIYILFSIETLSKNVKLTAEHPLEVTRASIRIEAMVLAMHRSMKDVSISSNKAERDDYITIVDNNEKTALELFDIVQMQILGDEGQELASKTRNIFLNWRSIREKVIAIMDLGNFEQAQNITKNEGNEYVEKIQSQLNLLSEYAATKAMGFNTESSSIARRTRIIMSLAFFFSAILGLIAIISVSLSITKRLREVQLGADKMALGNLNQSIAIEGQDELTDMARSFNIMAKQLKESYTDLETKVEQRTNQLKQSEEQYQALSENSKDVIIRVDNNFTFLYANQASSDLIGIPSRDFIGKKATEIGIDSNIVDKWKEAFQKVVNTGKARLIEFNFPRNIGERYFESNLVPELDSNANIRSLLITSRDITEKKNAEKLILKELREKEILLRELYHRTKNNMQVVSAMLRLKARSLNVPHLKRAFKDIENKVLVMALVHKKLYQAKDLSQLNLKSYIDDLILMIKQSYIDIRSEITIQTDLQEIPVLIDNAMTIGLIINELLSNSFQHAFPKKSEGIIKVTLSINPQKQMVLIISDNGVGLPKNFDLEKDINLGLKIVYDLAETQLGGKIQIIGHEGFLFRLALDKSAYILT